MDVVSGKSWATKVRFVTLAITLCTLMPGCMGGWLLYSLSLDAERFKNKAVDTRGLPELEDFPLEPKPIFESQIDKSPTLSPKVQLKTTDAK